MVSSTTPVLTLKELVVKLGGFTLGPINLAFKEGLYAILGPNGAGKTTLLRAIASVVARHRGVVRFGNLEVDRERAWKLISSNLVYEPLGFNAKVVDLARVLLARVTHEWYKRVHSVFCEFGVEWMLQRTWESLSAGQRLLAKNLIALAKPSPILLLDEPFANLDPNWTCRLINRLRFESSKRIVIYTTHEFNTLRYVDTVIIMKDGKIIALGSPESVLSSGILTKVYNVRFEFMHWLAPICS